LSPPSINGAAAGSLFGRVVLFGGWPASNLSGRLGGTWLWDSASWTKEPLDASTAPFGIAGATLGSTIVTFGGEDDWYEPTSNSSTWDGTKWTALRPAHVPDARRGASMAAFRGKVVLFGGEAAPNLWVPLGDTWTWDGSDWTKVTLAVSPPARAWSAMAATKNGVVLFGGSTIGGGPGDNGALGDTWVWDGASWTQRDVSGPSPRSGAVMAPL
jgi:hypothetical protein